MKGLGTAIFTSAHWIRITPAQTKIRKSNVILILADDIGYECFGCYGSKQYKTPHIDKLAETGIRFDHCYSQPLCTPSRIKIMTGQSNVRNYHDFAIMKPEEYTFAHMLKGNGYKTACAGKWQLYGHPNLSQRRTGMYPEKAGFDEYCLWQVDLLEGRYWGATLEINGHIKRFPKDVFGPDVCTDFITSFIDKNKNEPFFIYYPMILVHDPFLRTPDSKDSNSKNRQLNYEDMVCYMDKLVGQIASRLEEFGLREKTLIMFTGDNGTGASITSELKGQRIKGGKGQLTDAGTRVPLVANMPGTLPVGKVCNDLVDFSDFMPTLADFCGGSIPTKLPIDGISFAPQLKGENGNPREAFYCYYNPRPTRKDTTGRFRERRFARDHRWKLYGDGNLFDIEKDVLEMHPIKQGQGYDEARTARIKLQAVIDSMPAKPGKIKNKK